MVLLDSNTEDMTLPVSAPSQPKLYRPAEPN
jgi:hypothetical protein